MFTISLPRVCRFLPSRLFTCPRSSSENIPSRRLCREQHLVELNIFIIFLLLCLLMERAVVLMAWQSSGPCSLSRAVYKYWATLRCGSLWDVPLTIQVPAVFADLHWKVPQIPFIDRVLASSVSPQRQGSQCKLYSYSEIPQRSSWVGRRHARWCANDRALVRQWRKLWFRSCIPLTEGRCPRCAGRADSQVHSVEENRTCSCSWVRGCDA